ncbi:amino acid ABC transporter substrate-binding protein [Carnobacterium divergens]|uniref:Amino acid ABC transporter substrate-binding protein n=1 Tax=Carnobacterium divergens TaxID=2748 RepID=A0A7Z8G4V7_CARDV|nr:amino acid ABC transporter substrate-binding protein [Carnobacterium divergens]TFI71653.1 amino acid ABC transporter substrate-binding protein [Carnobacterium divergens]TFI76295.1 amino acid ABC transporter substrate-binding protein [Carnobacterium divergens]TFI82168.1 amino acid ABC transporter substrate-binding protein [Carnobacterium divergens]TFI94476.1 amino acid ABC transporter substrate-binding protein [Carnobacterium divergens]TFJ10756.1 amino acid ABC transporter substrate-binding 
MKIKMSIVLSIVGFSLLLVGCGNSKNEQNQTDATKEIEKSGKLVVGLDDTFAPMSYRDNKGEIVGFDVDLAKEVGKKLRLKIEFQAIDWAMKETELNAGNIDLIWNGYTITPERKEKVAFSDPYLENSQSIVVLKNSEIQTKKELAGKSIAAQQASSAVDAVSKKELATFKNQELTQFPSNNDVFNDLASKRSEAIVVDEVLARYYIKLKGVDTYRTLKDNFGKEEYGVGLRKKDKVLKTKLNQALKELKTDGTYDTIYQKWFAE